MYAVASVTLALGKMNMSYSDWTIIALLQLACSVAITMALHTFKRWQRPAALYWSALLLRGAPLVYYASIRSQHDLLALAFAYVVQGVLASPLPFKLHVPATSVQVGRALHTQEHRLLALLPCYCLMSSMTNRPC